MNLRQKAKKYKRELEKLKGASAHVHIHREELRHACLCAVIRREEVIDEPKDIVSPKLTRAMCKAFEDNIQEMPIDVSYDEMGMYYSAKLDLWMRNERRM